ncbi:MULTISPECIES: YqeG family HAD IIIA-type phosphatase [unclassified Lactobacillus]|uniref:YqeG family HAD IIIA-type phosphatase n=1 Tax=unclassified Lactobacillus TaxID=2620435 RepID=UPI000EFA37C3|nr:MULTISPECIES: YqeG family HAD IIIA-type phosphatase [unclassified Lactobacillus]RMC39141.1 YqeG family HAD IIIA-type phosphatase [Lactobacillus sp. ESL0237]RMC43424.1 YqeG family HAD IIIA-type phosphatase [Lactobacillus sp. ESL0234]RMC44336.1 YqeG family HAD IIIA-type phosphatase [Lactobacillus sp. ESL0236]RMC46773.1 YqeG family HAD IIIA-type phosphatase [Lactobacillus sp. ESL0230]RMC49436.1 YqeG family HAD IIIA-type phosphatase [Lactobacillus sp. ESL0225]
MLFRPCYTIDTIYHLDTNVLHQMGIKAVFSDLDNTLLAWDKFETAKEMDMLNQRLKNAGIKLVVISNNNAKRISKVLTPYHIEFIAKSRKPLPFAITRKREKMGLASNQVMMVGDQLITDIQAGNFAGVKSVLVKPLVKTDKWNTRINRFLEKLIFFFLALSQPITFKETLKNG